MKRRTRGGVVALTLVSLSVLVPGCVTTERTSGDRQQLDRSKIVLVTSVLTTANEYQLDTVKGSQAFADSVGVPLKVVNANLDSQQQNSQIQALMTTGKTAVVLINPVSTSDVPVVVGAAESASAYVVTQWNRPPDYRVQDHDALLTRGLECSYDGYATPGTRLLTVATSRVSAWKRGSCRRG
ncbi:hypothetical protein [Streptomyces niveus]